MIVERKAIHLPWLAAGLQSSSNRQGQRTTTQGWGFRANAVAGEHERLVIKNRTNPCKVSPVFCDPRVKDTRVGTSSKGSSSSSSSVGAGTEWIKGSSVPTDRRQERQWSRRQRRTDRMNRTVVRSTVDESSSDASSVLNRSSEPNGRQDLRRPSRQQERLWTRRRRFPIDQSIISDSISCRDLVSTPPSNGTKGLHWPLA